MTDIVERHKTETNVVDMQACWFYDCSTLRLISNRSFVTMRAGLT